MKEIATLHERVFYYKLGYIEFQTITNENAYFHTKHLRNTILNDLILLMWGTYQKICLGGEY